MAVFLHCCLCERKAVDGLLSRWAWAYLTVNPHGELQVCPFCREKHADWESRALETAEPAQTAS